MAEHTPGPWEEDITEDGLLRIIAPNAGDRHHETVCIIDDMETSTGQDHWNARLIAAAPELLAALESLLTYVENDNPGAAFGGDAEVSRLHEEACAALAKARGTTDD